MILITTLAEYQTRFWLKVAIELQNSGKEVVLLSFDDRSSELLDKVGLRSFNVPALTKTRDSDPYITSRKPSIYMVLMM